MDHKRENILNITEDCLGEKYSFIPPFDPLNGGGSGLVYKAYQVFDKDKGISIPRAIKFFTFREDLSEKLGLISYENFNTEIANITRFRHQNILKVIDGDYYKTTVDGQEIKVPYTVTEFIDGFTLEDFFNDDSCKKLIKCEDDVFDLLAQIACGIEYLHNNNFYHCDIAPKNIFIKSDDDAHCFAVIGDFGAGRTLVPQKRGKVLVIGTTEYMPEEYRSLKNTEISYSNFSKLQPRWDIYSLIKTITEIVQKINATELLEDTWHLDSLSEKINNNEYKSVSQILNDINRLRPSNNKVMNLVELSEASNLIRQVLIPLYPVYFSVRMFELSKHSMLLRLMDVSELLEGATTYPGANHTRYEHSLGTYELMRRAILALLGNKAYAKVFDERTIIIGLISALLSSLVRFPLSYAITEYYAQEKTTPYALMNRNLFVHLINYKSYDGSLYDAIKTKFPECKIQVEELQYVIFGKSEFCEENIKLEIMNKLLNSSVGVRVIDYLMRDSLHIGLKYRVDTNSLFSFMSIEKDRFCLKQSGIPVAEQVIINRYWMFKRVYWSEPNRANIALIKHLFYLANLNKSADDSKHFADELIKKDNYINIEQIRDCMMSHSEDNTIQKIKNVFQFLDLKGQKRYTRLLVAGSSDSRVHVIWSEIVKKSCSEQEIIREKLEEELNRFLDIDDDLLKQLNMPVILIDIPHEKQGNKLGRDVDILKFNGELEPLSKASATIGSMVDSFNEQLALLRIFVHPEIFEKYIKPKIKEDTQKLKEVENLPKESLFKTKLEDKIIYTLSYCTNN